MAQANTHTKKQNGLIKGFVSALVVVVLVAAFSLCAVKNAQGSGEVDTSTIGVGSAQASASSGSLTPASRISPDADEPASTVSEAADPSDSAQRSITVKDPDPVVVPVAVDTSNSSTLAKAKEFCTLDPLPTAPRVNPDVNDGTWSSGVASAYNVTTNDDGKGNFGVSTTASGVPLHNGSITVAVPESQSYLLGRACEIYYDGKVVVATVTDTGGFAKLGRSLDLAPGVYTALGASSLSSWGTRTVYYRFL